MPRAMDRSIGKRSDRSLYPALHQSGFVVVSDFKVYICGRQAFYDAVPKMFLKDGFVVKLKDKRKTVFGTAWYQCNHASVRVDKKHFRVVRWFGVARLQPV